MSKVNVVKHFVTIDNQTMPLCDACAKFKVDYSNIIKYMRRHHISAQDGFMHYYHPPLVSSHNSSHKLPLKPYVAFSQDHPKGSSHE